MPTRIDPKNLPPRYEPDKPPFIVESQSMEEMTDIVKSLRLIAEQQGYVTVFQFKALTHESRNEGDNALGWSKNEFEFLRVDRQFKSVKSTVPYYMIELSAPRPLEEIYAYARKRGLKK